MNVERTAHVVHLAYPVVYLRCHTRHERKRSSAYRISSRDATILAHLQQSSRTTPARLARHLGIARSTPSEALKRLVTLDYVERAGGKLAGVRLSAIGLEAVLGSSVLEHDRLAAVLETLTATERRRVVAGMRALVDECERVARGDAAAADATQILP